MIFSKLLPSRRPAALALALTVTVGSASADTYTIPEDLTSAPFNCTLAWGEYNCPEISLSKETVIVLTEPVTLNISGDFTSAKEFTTINSDNKFKMVVGGHVNFHKDLKATMDLTAAGNVDLKKDAYLKGDLVVSGNLTLAKDSTIDGSVVVSADLDVGHNSKITGTCKVGGNTNYKSCGGVTPPTPTPAVHHFHIEHAGSGLTCTASQVTVYACSGATAASGKSCPTTSVGTSGNLVVTNTAGGAVSNIPFTIKANESSTVVDVPYAGTKTVMLNTAAAGATCWNGTAASCQHVFYDSGFEYVVPDHVAATTTPVSIAAVRKGPTPGTCAAGWKGPMPVTFSCTYINPEDAAPGAGRAVTLIGSSSTINLICGGAAQALTIAFENDGTGKFDLTYPDAGKIQLGATYNAEAMRGSSTFITYPKKFEVTWPNPSATIVAGEAFRVKVTALNNVNEPTPNYGREKNPPESADLSFIRCLPAAGHDGVASGTLGSFAQGAAESTNSKWGEVGTIDVKARNTDYLGLAVNIEGSSNLETAAGKCTGLFGRFRPKYFKTSLPGGARTWAYSGEPFDVVVSGFNADDVATENYSKIGGFSKDITFSALGVAPDPVTANPGPGSMTTAEVKVAGQSDLVPPGGAVIGKPAYALTAPTAPANPVKPTKIAVCATDSDGVTSTGKCNAVQEIRVGRLRLSNAFGSVDRDLRIPVRVEYWSGSSWLVNTDDGFTIIPISALALSPAPNVQMVKAQGTEIKITGGLGSFMLDKPTRDAGHNGVGSVIIAANLGDATTDAACQGAHPITVGAKLPWLRSRNGTCSAAGATPAEIWSQDPTARASFGVTTRENRATIHVRESFN